jgi:3-oxoacyl-[acyl-carrier protein] reductase
LERACGVCQNRRRIEMAEKSLSGKVAFVTGAASKRGMGHAIAIRLAGEGAKVVVADKFAAPRSLYAGDEGWKGLDAVVQEIESQGGQALAVVADIASSKEIDAGVQKALGKFKKIDILVNCVGIRGKIDTPIMDLGEQDWQLVLDVNLTGAFFLSKAVAKDMVKRGEGGKIVHIASVAGRRATAGSSAYNASKFGLIGLVKSMALELARYKINVNAINPGFFVTNLRDEFFAEAGKKVGLGTNEFREQDYKKVTSLVPWGRMGTPEEIANLAFFLVSNQSDYMTGQDIHLNGGSYLP